MCVVLGVIALLVLGVAGVSGYRALSRGTAADRMPVASTGEMEPTRSQRVVSSSSPAPPEVTAGPVAGPGTSCGEISTIIGAAGRVRIDAGRITCAEATSVMRRYYDLPAAPDGENSAPRMFDGWTCFAATAESARQSGIGAACGKRDVELVLAVGDG